MAQFQRPRGTRDFGPEEMASRRWAESRMRQSISSFGYREIATPTFEHSDLFIARSGPQIIDQIYIFKDKGGRELALRPELTAPVMRFYYSDLRNLPKPLRIFYFGNCFRYERPQKGRYREFWQMGVEYIGKRTPQAAAEVILAAISSLKSTGLSKFEVRVGHVELLGTMLKRWGLDPSVDRELMIAIDKKDEASIRELLKNTGEKDTESLISLVTSTYGEDEYERILDNALNEDENLKKTADELRMVMSLLFQSGARVRMDPSISRGLDYYDGIVFEIDSPDLGAEKQICGGGAYSLTSVFGGDVEGIGFGLGFDRIMVALGGEAIPEPEGTDDKKVYVAPLDNGMFDRAFKISMTLREAGITCVMETSERNLKRSISSALSSGCRYLVILGEEETRKNTVSLKDLRTRSQTELPMDSLVEYILSS